MLAIYTTVNVVYIISASYCFLMELQYNYFDIMTYFTSQFF
jgi:hypothetical protein